MASEDAHPGPQRNVSPAPLTPGVAEERFCVPGACSHLRGPGATRRAHRVQLRLGLLDEPEAERKTGGDEAGIDGGPYPPSGDELIDDLARALERVGGRISKRPGGPEPCVTGQRRPPGP